MSIRYRASRKCYILDIRVNGKRRRLHFRTKKDAINYSVLNTSSDFIKSKSQGKSIFDAIREYDVHYAQSKDSYDVDKRALNIMLIFFDQREVYSLCEVNLKLLQDFQKWLQKDHKFHSTEIKDLKSLGPSTINRWFSTIKHFFNVCVKWDYLERSPSKYIEKLEFESRKKKSWTQEDFKKAHDVSSESFKDVLAFIYLTGARPSTVSRVNWSDVDFKNKRIRLKSKKGGQKKMRIYAQPFTESLEALLRKRLAVCNSNTDPDSPVFLNTMGGPVTADWISKKGSLAIKKANLKGLELYSLRHSLARDLLSKNVSTEIIRQILGHSKSTMTVEYLKNFQTENLRGSLELVRSDTSKESTTKEGLGF